MTGSAPVLPATGRPSLVRHVRMRWDASRERYSLLAPESVIVLNGTGADILGLCDGRTVAEIVTELEGRYDRVVADEVHHFLGGLVARRYVVIQEENPDG